MTPRKIAAFAIGPLGGALIGLITLPIITWLFSQEDVGRMAMLQVTLSFSTLLFSLGLDQSYVREFHEEKDRPALLKSAMLPGLTLLLAAVALILPFKGALSNWVFGVEQWHLSVLIAVALMANFVSRFLSLVLRMNERGLAYSMSQLLPKILLLAIVGIYMFVGADANLTNLIVANAAAIAAVCLVYGWNTRAEWLASTDSTLDLNRLKGMFRFGLPLILGGLAFWGLTTVDKLFLRTITSFDELGIYAVAVSFAGAAAILQSVFSTVWAPMVYKWASMGQGLEHVHRTSRYILALVVLGFALTGLLSWVVNLFLPREYRAVEWLLVSCVGYPLLYTLSETTVVGIGISRRSGFAMLAALIALGVSLLGNWLLVPAYGAAGAAASTCVAFWVFLVARTEFAVFTWKPMPRVLLYSYTTILVTGAVVHTLWGSKLAGAQVFFWMAVLASWPLAFRRELLEGYNVMCRRATKTS